MNLLLLIILLALATYRVTRFWIKDDLIAHQRIWLLNCVLGRKSGVIRGKLHELLGCHYCTSAHLAWIGVVVTMQWVSIPLPVLVWLAVWGVEPLLWRWSEDIIDLRIHMGNVVRHREDRYGSAQTPQ